MSLTLDEIIDAVAQSANIVEPRRADEFTRQDFVERLAMRGVFLSTWSSRDQLAKMVADGVLTKRIGPHNVALYRKVNENGTLPKA